jgi:hypothetical protein
MPLKPARQVVSALGDIKRPFAVFLVERKFHISVGVFHGRKGHQGQHPHQAKGYQQGTASFRFYFVHLFSLL